MGKITEADIALVDYGLWGFAVDSSTPKHQYNYLPNLASALEKPPLIWIIQYLLRQT